MLAGAAMDAAHEETEGIPSSINGSKMSLASKSNSRGNNRISGSSSVLFAAASPPMQQSVSGLAASLGKHEQIIARLRQQVNESLAAHQQRLTQELQHIIQATAAQAAAGASAGAAASAAAAVQWGQAAAAAVFRGDSVAPVAAGTGPALPADGTTVASATTSGATSAVKGAVDRSGNSCVDSQQLVAGKDMLVQLQAATARIQMLQQQLEAAEAKLTMHRAAAVAAKQRIASLEERMAHQQQLQNNRLLRVLTGRVEHQTEQPSPPQQQQQKVHHHHQQSGLLLGVPRTPESHSSEASHTCCGNSSTRIAAATQHASNQQHVIGAAEQGPTSNVAMGALLTEQQQQVHGESQGWDLIPSHGPAGGLKILRLRELERQAGSYQDQLGMAIVDNTVLCYECMHLQHLLVQERFVGRNACQAVALQLAREVVALRGQLEDAQVELDLQKFARKVGELAAVKSGNKQCQQQQQDEQKDEDAAGAAAGRTAAEWAQQCQASVQQTLDTNKAHNEAVLQLLDSRISAISCWYEDSSWADEVQQQLAAIEQVFAGAGPVQQQLQGSTREITQQQQQPLQDNREQLSPQLACTEADADPAVANSSSKPAKPYVTTPSGHVSLLASRRGTQVLAPFDSAVFRRTSALDSGSCRESRLRTRSCIGVAADAASVDGPCRHDANGAAPAEAVTATASSAATGCDAAAITDICTGSRAVGCVATAGFIEQLQPRLQQQPQPTRRTISVLQSVAEQLTADQQADYGHAYEGQMQQSCSLRATGESRYASVADDGDALHWAADGRFAAGAGAAAAGASGEDAAGREDTWPQATACIQHCDEAVCSSTNGWSDIAVDLVDALQQAAAAVLSRQGVPRYDHQQQSMAAAAAAAAAAVPGHSCCHNADYVQCATEQLQQQQQQQPHATSTETGHTLDYDEEAFWDAQETSSTQPCEATQQQLLEQQYNDCELQLLKQQVAEQSCHMLQLQEQLRMSSRIMPQHAS